MREVSSGYQIVFIRAMIIFILLIASNLKMFYSLENLMDFEVIMQIYSVPFLIFGWISEKISNLLVSLGIASESQGQELDSIEYSGTRRQDGVTRKE